MNAGNGLHASAVAQAEAVAIQRFHATDIGAAILRERDLCIGAKLAGHGIDP